LNDKYSGDSQNELDDESVDKEQDIAEEKIPDVFETSKEEAETDDYDEDDDDNSFAKHNDNDDTIDAEDFLTSGQEISFFDNLKATIEITSFEELISSSFAIGVTSASLFFVFFILMLVLSQFFGGVTPVLTEMFPQGYTVFSQIDKNFGGTHTVSLLLMFVPLFVVLLYFELSVLERYLDDILGRTNSEVFENRIVLYWTILSIVAVPFIGSQMVTIRYTLLGLFSSSLGTIAILLPFAQTIVTIASISFLYRCFSKASFSWKTSIVSGVLAGIVFEIVKNITLFIIKSKMTSSQMSDYVVILVIVAIWFFISSIIFTFCARAAYYKEFKDLYSNDNSELLKMSDVRATREVALLCLLEMTKRFYSNNGQILSEKMGMKISEICKVAVVTPRRARQVFSHLNKVSLIRVLRDKNEDVGVINFSPDSLSLEEFIFRIEERLRGTNIPLIPNCPANKWFWDEYHSTIKRSFSKMHLKDLYEMKFQNKIF